MKRATLLTFPYRANTKGKPFPIVPLTLTYAQIKKEFWALVDSGATISIFRAEVAESLGIKVEKGEQIYLGGVGGRIKGYIHKLQIEIAGKKFSCSIVFSYEYLISLNLLGRQAFFRKFRIIFEENKNHLKLE